MKTLYITPASPWENGYCESFNSKLRDELLAREIFYDLHEAKVLIEALVCIPKSGPVFELVPASDMELRHGQESQA